jgi:hypothetical protein
MTTTHPPRPLFIHWQDTMDSVWLEVTSGFLVFLQDVIQGPARASAGAAKVSQECKHSNACLCIPESTTVADRALLLIQEADEPLLFRSKYQMLMTGPVLNDQARTKMPPAICVSLDRALC